MTDPRLPQSNDGDSSNGSTPPMPRSHADRLPQPPPAPQAPITETLSPGMKRDIRRAFLILLGTGLVIGLLTATGIVLVMNHFNLIGVPEQTAP
ncbi:MAG: hypothetical protein ACHWZW_00860 [Spirulina sp.]